MHAGNLIFQSRAVMLINYRGGNKDEQVALMALVIMTLKRISKQRNVAEKWNFCPGLAHLIRKQTPNSQRIAALDQHVGIECARIDDRTGYVRLCKLKMKIPDFVADFRLHRER